MLRPKMSPQRFQTRKLFEFYASTIVRLFRSLFQKLMSHLSVGEPQGRRVCIQNFSLIIFVIVGNNKSSRCTRENVLISAYQSMWKCESAEKSFVKIAQVLREFSEFLTKPRKCFALSVSLRSSTLPLSVH